MPRLTETEAVQELGWWDSETHARLCGLVETISDTESSAEAEARLREQAGLVAAATGVPVSIAKNRIEAAFPEMMRAWAAAIRREGARPVGAA